MKTARSLGSQSLATVYIASVSVFLTFILARWFGPETFGRYSYIVTLASLFAILQDGGFRTLLFREGTVASNSIDPERLFASALGHLLLVSLSGLLLLILVPMADALALFLAVCAFGLGTLVQFISGHLKGKGRFGSEAGWRALSRTLSALGIVGCLFLFSPKPEWVLAGWIAGTLLCLWGQSFYPLRSMSVTLPKRETYKSITALVVIDFATLIYFKIDIVMLRYLMDDLNEVGFYTAASRLLEGVLFILFPLANVFFRDLKLLAEDRPRFYHLLNRLTTSAVFLACVLVTAGFIFGEAVFVFCFGDAYRNGIPVLPWLISGLLFMIPNLILTQATLACGKERNYALGACGAAFLNGLLNWNFIPRWGARGAALATLATEGLLLVFIATGLYRSTGEEEDAESA